MFVACEKGVGGGDNSDTKIPPTDASPSQTKSGCYSAHTDILTASRENEDLSGREVTLGSGSYHERKWLKDY